MYKPILIVLFACCTAYGRVAAQSSPDVATIRHILDTQVSAWNKGNIDDFVKGYWNNDSLMFIGKNGPEYGYTLLLQHYKKSYPSSGAMGTLVFDHLIFRRLSPQYYFVVGGWHLHRQGNGGDVGGTFTLLLRKISGVWKIVVDHTS